MLSPVLGLSINSSRYVIAIGFVLTLWCVVSSTVLGAQIDFNQDIRPLLSDNCFACHGPDANTREADLRLDIRNEAVKSIDGMRAIVPGKSSESEIIARILSTDPDDLMPPPESGKELTAQQKELIKQWIDEGAQYQEHWSFKALSEPKIPDVYSETYPSGLTPIDKFLLSSLQAKGLDFSEKANPETLVRRLSFDLLGLPPRPEWVSLYSKDPSEKNYISLVETMLASPHFGERMAVFWLDLVRYADTIGYHSDTHREVSGFRDYVIHSFNSNKPYDLFTKEQIAGDLLESEDPWVRIASGYNRLLQTTEEGGAQAKEYRAIYAADRVRNVSGVWMGTTLGCAQCHDHKYDPFTAKDFYSMAAFFADINEPAVGKQQPNYKVPVPENETRLSKLKAQQSALDASSITINSLVISQYSSGLTSTLDRIQNVGLSRRSSTSARDEKSILNSSVPFEDMRFGRSSEWDEEINRFFIVQFEKTDSEIPRTIDILINGKLVVSKFPISQLIQDDHHFVLDVPAASFGNNSSVQIRSSDDTRVLLCGYGWRKKSSLLTSFNSLDALKFSKEISNSKGKTLIQTPDSIRSLGGADLKPLGDGSYLSSGKNPGNDTYEIHLPISGDFPVHGIYLEALRHDSLANKSLSRANGNFVLTGFEAKLVQGDKESPLEFRKPVASFEQGGFPVVNTLDGKPNTGWAVHGWEKFGDRQALFPFKNALNLTSNSVIKIVLKHESQHKFHNIGRFRISLVTSPASNLKDIKPLDPKIKSLVDEFISYKPGFAPAELLMKLAQSAKIHSKHYQSLRAQKQKVKDEIEAINKAGRSMLVVDRVTPRMTRILPRGDWLDDSGEAVLPAVPAFLPQSSMPKPDIKKRADRLDLAQWIIHEDNPLTSRTMVNRLWKLYFGYGLSRNLDDLGGQGEPPTHPELLDYLSSEFISNNWDVKGFIKSIVLSKSYRQSSTPSEWLLINDPNNRLYARQSRFRLDAEFVRDTALDVSGLIVHSVGGGNAKPYQPAGYWQHLNFPKRRYQNDSGDGLYRRGLYTFWCRTFLHPAMLAFDAPSREECTAERPRSNTPQQALVLLNDISFVEAANALAFHSAKEIRETPSARSTRSSRPSPASRISTPVRDVRLFGASVKDPDISQKVIARIFYKATSRKPLDEELEILSNLYSAELKRFENEKGAAKALLETGQLQLDVHEKDENMLGAFASVARAVLNLYETTSRY